MNTQPDSGSGANYAPATWDAGSATISNTVATPVSTPVQAQAAPPESTSLQASIQVTLPTPSQAATPTPASVPVTMPARNIDLEAVHGRVAYHRNRVNRVRPYLVKALTAMARKAELDNLDAAGELRYIGEAFIFYSKLYEKDVDAENTESTFRFDFKGMINDSKGVDQYTSMGGTQVNGRPEQGEDVAMNGA